MNNKINKSISLFFITMSLLFNLSSQLSSKQLDISLINTNNKNKLIASTEICIGSSFNQCFNIQLDFQSFSIWVIDSSNTYSPQNHRFNQKESSTFKLLKKKISFSFNGKQFGGIQGKDNISFSSETKKKEMSLIFNIVKSPLTVITEEVDGSLGFGYLTKDNNELQLSFMNQLLLEKVIDYDVFAIDFLNDSKAKIYLGDYPSKIVYDYHNYGTCDLIFNTPAWECSSQRVIDQEDKKTKTNNKVVFSPMNKAVSPPNKLKEDIWNLLPNVSKLCSRKNNINEELFICQTGSLTYRTIAIKFDNWELAMPIESLFSNENESVLFSFTSDNNDSWILGYNYLRYFTLVFDRHNEKIGFYHQQWLKYIGRDHLSKPSLTNHMGPSLIPKKMPVEAKPTDSTVSFVLNLFMLITVLTVIFVVIALIYDYLKKSNNNDTVIPYYSKTGNELYDTNSRSSKL